MGNAGTDRVSRQYATPPIGGGRHYGQYQGSRPPPATRSLGSPSQQPPPNKNVQVVTVRATMILFGVVVGLAFGGWGGGIVAATCAFGLVYGLLSYLRNH